MFKLVGTETKSRLGYLDAIKGLCMLLVLVDHSGFRLPPLLDYVEVPVFFMISGCLFKNEPLKDVILKKNAQARCALSVLCCRVCCAVYSECS